jgi:hypothetical protein
MINSIIGQVSLLGSDVWRIRKYDDPAEPANPEAPKPQTLQSIPISSAPTQYRYCLGKADVKGNNNGETDSTTEAVNAVECFYKKTMPAADNLEFLKLLENTNFTLRQLKTEMADAEVENQIGLLSSLDKMARKKALLTLGYLAGASFVSLPAKEKMIDPLRQALRDKDNLPSLEIALAFVKLFQSDLPTATKERMSRGIVRDMGSKKGDTCLGAVNLASEVISSLQLPQELRAGLLAQIIEADNSQCGDIGELGLSNMKFATFSGTCISEGCSSGGAYQIKGKGVPKMTMMPEKDFEPVVVDTLLACLNKGKKGRGTALVFLSEIITSGNFSNQLNRKMAVPLANAIMMNIHHLSAKECADLNDTKRDLDMLKTAKNLLPPGQLKQRVAEVLKKCTWPLSFFDQRR